jgi:ankyrin repeat protein
MDLLPQIQRTEVVEAAFSGNLERLKEFEASGIDFNLGDYDDRTPLHLAASEGKFEVVKYLLAKGVDVNAKDRWHGTPLADALRGKHTQIIRLLQEKGAKTFNIKTDLRLQLCQAAADGDLDQVKNFVLVSDVNSGDYDYRTPLHLAASEGKIEVVRFLIEHGAKVNVQDRWGGTPIQEASRNNFSEIVQLLKSHGATLQSPEQLQSVHDFTSSLQKAISLLCDRGNWIYGAALIPDKEGKIHSSNAWYGSAEFVNDLATYRKISEIPSLLDVEKGKGLAGRVFRSKEPEWVEDSSVNGYSDFFNKEIAKEIGFKAALAVPVVYDNKPLAILLFRTLEPKTRDEEEIKYYSDVANRLIIAGLSASLEPNDSRKQFAKGVFREQMNVVSSHCC